MQPESRLQMSRFSSHTNTSLITGILQQMSLCLLTTQSMLCCLFFFNVLQTPQLTPVWSLLPPVFQSWNCDGLRAFSFLWFSRWSSCVEEKVSLKESREVIIKHWRSLLYVTEPSLLLLLLQDTAEAVVRALLFLVCPCRRTSRSSGGRGER